MISVVFYHCILIWQGKWFPDWFPDITITKSSKILGVMALWFNSFHIYCFTLVSGYLFYFIKFEKKGYQQFLPFIKLKIKRLIVPYLFIAFAWIIPIYYIFFGYPIKNIFNDFILAMHSSQLWFLIMLFNVFLIAWPLSNIFAKHHLVGMFIALGFYILYIVESYFINYNIFNLSTACKYLIIFWCGFKMRQLNTDFFKKIPIFVYISADFLIFLLWWIRKPFSNSFITITQIVLYFLLHIIGAIAAFLILQKIASFWKWQNCKYFLFFSKCSMSVYLLHMQIVFIFIYLTNNMMSPCLHSISNFIVTTGVSLLISSLLLRFRITKFLIGEK